MVNQNSRKDDGFKIGFKFASEKIGGDFSCNEIKNGEGPPFRFRLERFDERRNTVDTKWHFIPSQKNNTLAQINEISFIANNSSIEPLYEIFHKKLIEPYYKNLMKDDEARDYLEEDFGKQNYHCYEEFFNFYNLIPEPKRPTSADPYSVGLLDEAEYIKHEYTRSLMKLDKIYCISAERMGPREVYDTTKCEEEIWVGHKGQYVAQYIHENASKRMNDKFYKKGVFNNSLLNLTNYWLSEIISDSEINIEKILKTNLFTLSFRQNNRADFLRPSNCAFGLSYTLPIIVACLSIGEDQTLIIENPEAHLHPTAQSRMGEFLALTASTGANVIIETHSDHVLNGIRKAVYSQVLDPEEVCITFFSKEKNGSIRLQSPEIDEKGKISEWPKGFFDQFELDLSFLMGYKDESIS